MCSRVGVRVGVRMDVFLLAFCPFAFNKFFLIFRFPAEGYFYLGGLAVVHSEHMPPLMGI